MRLFIAIQFSEEIKKTLLRTMSNLQKQADGVFTRPENLHLTLAFLGETGNTAGVEQAMDAAAGMPFPLSVGGCGHFGDLWWAGVQENPALSALSRRLRRELDIREIEYDRKPFRPHITLAREVSMAQSVKLEVPMQTMMVSRLSLVKSERVAGRLVYTEVWGRNL